MPKAKTVKNETVNATVAQPAKEEPVVLTTLNQLQAGDLIAATNPASPFSTGKWFVALVSLSQRWFMLAQCGNVENRFRVSEFEFTQGQFILKKAKKRDA